MNFYKKIGKLNYFSCVSTAIYNALLEQSPEMKEFCFIVPNFIDTEIFDKTKYNIENNTDSITIVYSGRINREKGLDILVKAAEIVSGRNVVNLKLLLIGPSDINRGGSGIEYVNELNTLAVNTEIEWVEAISEPESLALELLRGDIYVYPSVVEKGEAFGVAPLEAMGLGIPVVVSRLECFQDFISDGDNGVVFNHRAADPVVELASKLNLLIDNVDLRTHVAENGYKTSRDFSIEAIAKKYCDKFEEILNG